jgi:hypothetical protein
VRTGREYATTTTTLNPRDYTARFGDILGLNAATVEGLHVTQFVDLLS